MRGRMAKVAGTRRGHHRPASTARTLPAQRTWADELRRIQLQEDADVEAGLVVRRYTGPNDCSTYVRYDPPDSEDRRAFILGELQAICDHAEREGFVREHELLADEIERVKVMELVP